MRHSTTARHKGHEWMDRERAFREELHPDEIRVEAAPLVRLLHARVSVLDHRLSLLRELGR
ncbi:hypothetical protein, partial [Pantoea sp. GbtcB22]|uniref:hypothetical protein n=1 Tax=Pantoea sp. GbtcB22 TaxID=2824767 RepID=UPI001C2FA364